MTQALELFKEFVKHTFTISQCWVGHKEYPKWQKRFSQLQKDSGKKRANDSVAIDLEDGGQSNMARRLG
jgi:hypothetical protein